ncbi:hypothetical protein M434DRAFT_21055 [Hypoxylon sp. CO27-5]|nr:hypothetical protein M434DRAFT_21055 [Hypoxylon sp. CO27-5]
MKNDDLGFKYPPIKCSYNRRDVLLFANAIGVQQDELHLLYELQPKFAMFPTFPVNLAYKRTDQDVFDFIARNITGTSPQPDVPGVPPFVPQRSVDGESTTHQLRGARLRNTQQGGAMILESEGELIDVKTNMAYVKPSSTSFGIGQGGYGGPRGPSKPSTSIPKRARDAVHTFKTSPEAGLLYRLCGDYNPMHADDEVGKQASFKGAILQGLGTWNIAAHGLLRELGDSDPERLKLYRARFKSVVYPDDELETRMWIVKSEGGFDHIVFETIVKDDGRVALCNGATVKVVMVTNVGT